MLKIAVIDHHLNNFHANKFLELLRSPLAGENAEIVAAWESDPVGDDWCARNGICRAGTLEEAVRAADAVMILAPDNVDSHLRYANAVLPFGKPTLVDKFLAPTLKEALEIVALARRHSAPLFSSSALRYAVELEAVWLRLSGVNVEEMFMLGPGVWEGYGVHSLMPVLRVMGGRVRRVIDTGTARTRAITLDYGQNKRALLQVGSAANEMEFLPWSFGARVGDKYIGATVTDYGGFYANFLARVLAFFKTGQSDMEIEESLATVAILEAANRSRAAGGQWEALEL